MLPYIEQLLLRTDRERRYHEKDMDVTMQNLQQAMDYLQQEALLHIDMLETIRRGKAEIVEASPKGVLLYHIESDVYMISTQDVNAAQSMISRIQSAQLFVAHQPFCLPLIEQRLGLHPSLTCVQAAYLKAEPVVTAVDAAARIERLDESHLTFISTWYSHVQDPEYLLERLNAGVIYGAYVEGALAGFIGEHAEGSIGMLEILPQFRRRGLGEQLEGYKTNQHLQAGFVPFGQIAVGNTPSLKLQRKLGYTISEDTITWLH